MIGGDLRLDFPVAVALALVPAALTFWWRRKADPALRYADTALLPWAVIGDHTRTRAWRVWAWWLGWLALAIAAAGPSRPAGDSEPGVSASARGALVIVVLDASDPSTDRFGPSFHEQVRIALADLTAQMRGARFALIAYAADAGVLLPETIDPALVAHFADVAVDVFLSIDAEDPAAGLGAALALANAIAGERRPAIALLAHQLPRGADRALGVGLAADRLRGTGQPIVALAPPALQTNLRTLTDARVFGFDDTQSWVAAVDAAAERDEQTAKDSATTRGQPAARLWLVLALLLLGAAHIEPGRLRRLVPGLALAAGLGASTGADASEAEVAAWDAYRGQDYANAQLRYHRIEGFTARFGEGAAAYRRGAWGAAAEQFATAALLAEEDRNRAAALYNLGNAEYAGGDPRAAVEAWLAGLLLNPADSALRHNLQMILQQLPQAAPNDPNRPGRAAEAQNLPQDNTPPGFGEDPAGELGPLAIEADAAGGWAIGRGIAHSGTVVQGASTAELRAARRKLEFVRDEPGQMLRELVDAERK